MNEFVKFKKRLNTYTENINDDIGIQNIVKIIQDGVRVGIVGNQFFGIQNLENTKTKERVTLVSEEGRVDLIALWFSAQASLSHIEKLLEGIRGSKRNVHLHVIKKPQTFEELEKLQKENEDILTVYSGGPDVKEIDLLSVRSVRYVLVVNEKGVTIHAGDSNGVDFETLISKEEKTNESAEFAHASPLDALNAIVEG